MVINTNEQININTEKIETAVKLILEAIGENINRDGIVETPRRVANMYKEVFRGLNDDPAIHLSKTFKVDHEELVLVKDIPFFSMCEHHLLPFYGKAHVGYIPNKQVTGLSKFARALEAIARRPQVQERITNELADAVYNSLNSRGVIVVLEAEHMCMSMRGINKPGSVTVTTSARGIILEDISVQNQILSLINCKRG